jgi:hypothetical protein
MQHSQWQIRADNWRTNLGQFQFVPDRAKQNPQKLTIQSNSLKMSTL